MRTLKIPVVLLVCGVNLLHPSSRSLWILDTLMLPGGRVGGHILPSGAVTLVTVLSVVGGLGVDAAGVIL